MYPRRVRFVSRFGHMQSGMNDRVLGEIDPVSRPVSSGTLSVYHCQTPSPLLLCRWAVRIS